MPANGLHHWVSVMIGLSVCKYISDPVCKAKLRGTLKKTLLTYTERRDLASEVLISQHRFTKCFGALSAPTHFLNQW